MATVAYGSLPFQQQIAFFRSKQDVLTESWLDLWEAEHDNGFMVAGANRIELLADLRDAVRRAIDDGETLSQFRKRFDALVAKHGWDYNGGRNWRSRVIYETNLRQSYNAGRWAQLQRLKKSRPWWRYRHSDAVEHPRPHHLSWDGLILHCDDPWWLTHFPANGWGCQCYVEALSDDDLKRLGLTPGKAPPEEYVDAVVGQRSPGGPRLVRTPVGIDPGFGYAPGASLDTWPAGGPGPRTPPAMRRTLEQSAQDLLRKSLRLPAATAAPLVADVLALRRARDALQAGYAEFQAAVVASAQPRNASYLVGALDADLVAALAAQRLEPATVAIVARDAEVLHALRDSKSVNRRGLPIGLTADELARLPGLLRSPRAILLDRADGALLYVVDASGRRDVAKVVIRVNYRMKLENGRETANAFRTATLASLDDLDGEVRGGLLQVLRGALK